MKKFVIATNNPKKLVEIQRILSPLGIDAVSQKQAGITVEPIEDGDTFEANALIKAREISKESGMPAVGDDSGLCVNALDGRPGVYSARYAGEDTTDEMKIEKLLNELKDKDDRSAYFVSAVCCYFSENDYFCVRGVCDGEIALSPSGNNGFGYDPVFRVKGLNKTYAELTAEEKDICSHRGKALRALREELLIRKEK